MRCGQVRAVATSLGGCGADVEDAYQCADYSCRGCVLNPNDPSTFDAYGKCRMAAANSTCQKFGIVVKPQCPATPPRDCVHWP